MGMFSTVEDLIDTSAHVTTFMLSVHLHAKWAAAKKEVRMRVVVGESMWPGTEGMLWGPFEKLKSQPSPGQAV